jgi:hypothetical protein
VIITKLTGSALIKSGLTITEISEIKDKPLTQTNDTVEQEIMVYPNPASDLLNISFNGEIQSIRLVSVEGKVVSVNEEALTEKQIDIHHLSTGMYILWIQSNNEWYPVKFMRM